MTSQVGLIPLRCTRCNTPVPASSDEVAWVCHNCRQGLLLDPMSGLVPLPIHYSNQINPSVSGRPFWVAQGQVSLVRTPHGSQSQKIVEEVDRFWGHGRMFFIPASDLPLEQFLSLAVQLMSSPPELTDGPAVPFVPVTLAPEDLKKICEVIVMAIEVQRKDQLQELEISLQLAPPDMWILP